MNNESVRPEMHLIILFSEKEEERLYKSTNMCRVCFTKI